MNNSFNKITCDGSCGIVSQKPMWLVKRLPSGSRWAKVEHILLDAGCTTVCHETRCPNRGECFSRGTATFLILGNSCTRQCTFCAVDAKRPEKPDHTEPSRIASLVRKLNMQYVVVSSVTRDDLPDGGAEHFAETIRAIRHYSPRTTIEVLIPDFQGSEISLLTVVDAHPDVIGHNIETVPRLYPRVRPGADYQQSLEVLHWFSTKNPDIIIKSGLMLGMGEVRDEVTQIFGDLLSVNCKILTVGQYLQPSRSHIPVVRYLSPEEFEELKYRALRMGFCEVVSGPYVRSSYRAGEMYENIKRRKLLCNHSPAISFTSVLKTEKIL